MREVIKYVQDTLIKKLGLLEMRRSKKMQRDEGFGLSLEMNIPQSRTKNEYYYFIRVHQDIHQQYAQYLSILRRKDEDEFLLQCNWTKWNQTVVKIATKNPSTLIGYPEGEDFSFQVFTSNIINALDFSMAAKTLRNASFVRSRLSNLGIWKGSLAHIIDVEELMFCNDDEMNDNICLSDSDKDEVQIMSYREVQSHMTNFLVNEEEKFLILLNSTSLKLGCEGKELETLLQNSSTVKDAAFALAKIKMQIGNSLHLMAVSLGSRGFTNAERNYYTEALAMKRSSIDLMYQYTIPELSKYLMNHPYNIYLAETLHSVGYIHDCNSEKENAVICYDEAYRIRKRLLGKDHPDIATTLHNVGTVFCENGECEVAFEYLEEALRIRELNFGDQDESVGDTLQWMGNVYREWNDSEEAIVYFEGKFDLWLLYISCTNYNSTHTFFIILQYIDALIIKKATLGENHFEVADALVSAGYKIYWKIKNFILSAIHI